MVSKIPLNQSGQANLVIFCQQRTPPDSRCTWPRQHQLCSVCETQQSRNFGR
nr:hypothetical protein Iba_chr04fCG4680 [Ipomoea batatas]